MRLTVRDRILLHLLDFRKHADALEVPLEMTQEGLAQAAWIEQRHVTQYVRPMIREGLLRERVAHVRGIRQRRKVYDLSDSGQLAAVRLRETVRSEVVRVQDADGVHDMTVAEVLKRAEGKASPLGVARRFIQSGTVDLASLTAVPHVPLVEVLSEAPRVEEFVGRQRELEAVTQEADRPRIFVVRGMAGIGKSTLAARACEMLRGSRNLFWHRVRSWDTHESVLATLGEFLSSLGKPGLRAVLVRGEANRAPDVLREDLPGAHAFLVFDDAHEANKEVVSLFRFLKDAAVDARDVRVILLTRVALPFYDRRDVAVDGLVQEIDLGGLGSEDVATLLAEGRAATSLMQLGMQLGGHPLFLRLIRSAPTAELASDVLRDVRRFVEEAIYEELSEAERQMMKIASLYRVPVPRGALFPDAMLSHDVLLSLMNRTLVLPVGPESFEVHDTIREFFVSVLSPPEQWELGAFAVGQLRDLSSQAAAAGDFVSSIDCLSNALQLSASPETRVSVSEALGDANRRVGNLPGSLIAYREAAKVASEPEVRARFHRKTAATFLALGEIPSASEEIESGFWTLRETPSVERGFLDLARCDVSIRLEDWEEAREHGNAALQTFRVFPDVAGRAQTLLALGHIEILAPDGNPSVAEECLTTALDLAKSIEDFGLTAAIHNQLAHLFSYRRADPDRAMEHIAAIEALPEGLVDPNKRLNALMLKGWFNLDQRADLSAAEAHFTDAMALARKIYVPSSIAIARYGLAYVTYFRGKVNEARREFARFAMDIHAQGFPSPAAESMWMVAECCLVQGDLQGFNEIVSAFGDPKLSHLVEARPVLAQVVRGIDLFLRGDPKGSDSAFADAIRRSRASLEREEWLPHFAYGIVLRAMRRDGEAIRQLRKATKLLRSYGQQANLASLAERERALTETLLHAAPRS